MRLPVMPPVEPMLAKAVHGVDEVPDKVGPRAVRAEVGRLPLHRVPRRRRDRAREPQRTAAHALLPRAASSRCASQLPDAVVLDGEIVIVGDGRPRLRRAPAASAPRRVAGEEARGRDPGVVRRVRPPRARRRRPAATTPFRERRATLERRWSRPSRRSTSHPMTDDRDVAERLVPPVRGRRVRRCHGEAARASRTNRASAAMLKVKHERTADCVVGGFRVHKDGNGRRLAAARPLRRRRRPAPRRRRERFGRRRRARAARRDRAVARRTRSRATRGATGPTRRRPTAAGKRMPGGMNRWNAQKDMSWEPLRSSG